MTITTEKLETLIAGTTVSDARKESLAIAIELGADDATLAKLIAATRLSRKETITLPANRLENLSRGRGWCRLGQGDNAAWGERVDGGYRVGVGRWTVGATDGFSRKKSDVWSVKHITVCGQTWTVAD